MDRIDKLRLALEQYSDCTPQDERLCKLILAICSESPDSSQRLKLMD